MFFIVLLFVLALLLPLAVGLWGRHDEMLEVLAVAAGVVVVALVVLRLTRRWRGRGDRAGQTRMPAAARVASLDWPRGLASTELETYCTVWLQSQGWYVQTARSAAAHGVYLQAELPGARALLVCESQPEQITPLSLRSLAFAAQAFEHAKPVVLTPRRVVPATAAAAAAAGVALLTPPELKQLASLAATAPAETTPPPP